MFSDALDDVPLVKGENIGQGEVLWGMSKRWSLGDGADLSRYRLAPDDVVLAMDRPWVPAGLKFARIRAADPEALLVQRVARLRASNGLSQRFLFCVVSSRPFADYIQHVARGVGVPHISGKQIAEFEFAFPPTSIQERVADVLCSYDDLIDNNKRRIALLDQAAQELYREWFVRLRFPGREHTAIQDGVPRRWQRSPLGNCVRFRSGGTPSKAREAYWNGDTPWVSSGEMTERRIYDTSLHISQDAVEDGSALAAAGSILIVVRGMSLAKEFRIATIARGMAFNQDLKALECRLDVTAEFMFHALYARREHLRDLATEASHGTKKLETPVLERFPILVPDVRLQALFREQVSLFNQQRDTLHQQNVKLRAARDLLLPRLISGEIAV